MSRGIAESDVKSNVEHCCCLNECADHQRLPPSHTINDDGNVEYRRHQLHETVDTCGQKRRRPTLDSDHFKDVRGKVVQTVRAGELVEQEEGCGKEEPAPVARNREDVLEDDPVVVACSISTCLNRLHSTLTCSQFLLGINLGAHFHILLLKIVVVFRQSSKLAQVLQAQFLLAPCNQRSRRLDNDYPGQPDDHDRPNLCY